jgi:putative phosphoesterase
MKLLVMSDSHKNISRMIQVAEQEKPHAILHLGDHISDAYELQRLLPDTEFHMVKGNCDYSAHEESELLLSLGGVKVFMTHGHIYGVKHDLTALLEEARLKGADLALFGHTHLAMLRQEAGLYIMNPGQMQQHDSLCAASYGIVTIEGGAFKCDIMFLPL